jgi:integration host factor subunit alpha
MTGTTATRVELTEAVYHASGLPRHGAALLVEQVLAEMSNALAGGENVKLSGFGVFTVRDKAERIGRNPKTGIEVPIEPRRAVTFKASETLKEHVNGKAVSSPRA